MRYKFTLASGNRKTGPIPVTMTSNDSCPSACPFKQSGACYARFGVLRIHWDKVPQHGIGIVELASKVSKLPHGQLWRHNQAGDLPGCGDSIDFVETAMLIKANTGRRGFTYTHKPLSNPGDVDLVRYANAMGFTINLSANSLVHADELADKQCAPVVVVLPESVKGLVRNIETPKGRKVVVCPATYREDTTCATCGLCQKANRSVIVGFPLHGTGKRKYASPDADTLKSA